MPARIRDLLMPVASTTAAMPPCPTARASLAAHKRVTRSSITLRSCSYFARIDSTSHMLDHEPAGAEDYFHGGIDNSDRAPNLRSSRATGSFARPAPPVPWTRGALGTG